MDAGNSRYFGDLENGLENSLKSVDVAGEICDSPTEWLFWL